MKKLLFAIIPLTLLLGCANFSKDAHKTIYASATLADGGMKTYGSWWKDQKLEHGDSPALEQQKTNVMLLSIKVGSTLAVASHALDTYDGKVGTNTTTKAVVNGLILTAVQEVGNFVAQVGLLTGNTNLIK